MTFSTRYDAEQEITGTSFTVGEQVQPDMTPVGEDQYALVYLNGLAEDSISFELRGSDGTSASGALGVVQRETGDASDQFASPKVIQLENGTFVVAWLEVSADQPRLVGRIVNASGSGFVGDQFLMVSGSADAFDLAPKQGGGFVVLSEGTAVPFFRTFDDAGSISSPDAFPRLTEPGSAATATSPAIAAMPDGGFVTALIEEPNENGGKLIVSVYNADLTPRNVGEDPLNPFITNPDNLRPDGTGEPLVVQGNRAAEPDLAVLPDGTWVVAYNHDGNILAAAGPPNGFYGAAQGALVQVRETVDVVDGGLLVFREHRDPSISVVGDRLLAIASVLEFSSSDDDVRVRLIEASSSLLSGRVEMAGDSVTVAAGAQDEKQPVVVMTGDQRLITTFRDDVTAAQNASEGDGSQGTVRTEIARIERVATGGDFEGSSLDEIFNGDGARNTYDAGGGDDVLRGEGEADSLEGGPGRDEIFGGDGSDLVTIRDGDFEPGETYDGGEGFDTLQVDRRVQIDLRADDFTGFERISFIGSATGDTASTITSVTLALEDLRLPDGGRMSVSGSEPQEGFHIQRLIIDARGEALFDGSDLPEFQSWNDFDLDRQRINLEFGVEDNVVFRLDVAATISTSGGEDVISVGRERTTVLAGSGDDVIRVTADRLASRDRQRYDGQGDNDRLELNTNGQNVQSIEVEFGRSDFLEVIDLRGADILGIETIRFTGQRDGALRLDAETLNDLTATLTGRAGLTDRVVIDVSDGDRNQTVDGRFSLDVFDDPEDGFEIIGSGFADQLSGTSARDIIRSGVGRLGDNLRGRGGEDMLVVQAGSNATVRGDESGGEDPGAAFADVFRIERDAERARIFDFAPGVDKLDLRDFTQAEVDEALANVEDLFFDNGTFSSQSIAITVDGIEITFDELTPEAFLASDVMRARPPAIVGDLTGEVEEGRQFGGSLRFDLGNGEAPARDLTGGALVHPLGELLLSPLGGYTFVPSDLVDALDEGERQVARFIATAGDGVTAGEVAITVVGVNSAPILQAFGSDPVEIEAGSRAFFDLSAFADDPDAEEDGAALTFDVDFLSAPLSAVVQGTGGATLDATGPEALALNAGDRADASVSLFATDSRGSSSETQLLPVTIIGVNDAPTLAAPDAPLTMLEDDEFAAFQILSTLGDDADGEDDGSSLGYRIVASDPLLDARVDDTQFGPGLFVDASPAAQALGAGEVRDLEIRLVAMDRRGAESDPAVFRIRLTGENDAPRTERDAYAAAENGITPLAALAANDDDPDAGETPVLARVAGQAAPDGAGRIDLPGGGVLIFAEDGSMAFDPNGDFEALSEGETGRVDFTYVVTDGRTEVQGDAFVEVAGANDAPGLQPLGNALVLAEEQAFSTTLDLRTLGFDPDGEDDGASLGYALVDASPLLLATVVEGELVLSPSAAAQALSEGEAREVVARVRATDTRGASSGPVAIPVRITGENDPYAAVDDVRSAGEDGRTPLAGLFDNDQDADEGDAIVFASLAGTANPQEGDRIALPEGGALIVGADGALVFDAQGDFEALTAGQTRAIEFGYEGRDVGGTSAASVSLTVQGANEATVSGSSRSDKLVGDGGANTIKGGRGNDDLDGGAGNDKINGGAGRDKLDGGRGKDALNGAGGDDVLIGGGGNDRMNGGGGNDRMNGQGGNDRINGQNGADRIKGAGGKDRIDGGNGSDEINGGRGNDRLKGGKAQDDFQFRRGDGKDTIVDFSVNQDDIEITRGAKSFGQLEISQRGKHAFVEYGGRNDVIKLLRTDADDLDASNFMF